MCLCLYASVFLYHNVRSNAFIYSFVCPRVSVSFCPSLNVRNSPFLFLFFWTSGLRAFLSVSLCLCVVCLSMRLCGVCVCARSAGGVLSGSSTTPTLPGLFVPERPYQATRALLCVCLSFYVSSVCLACTRVTNLHLKMGHNRWEQGIIRRAS